MNKSLFITQNILLLLLFALLLIFFKGPSLIYGALSFLLVAMYHLFTDRRFSVSQIIDSGLMGLHLCVYMLLCSLIIWSTTGEEESHYWIIYFLPIVVAASNLNLIKTLTVCFFSSFFYLILIPFEIWSNPAERAEDLPEFLISCTTFFIVGIVIHGFSQQNRQQLLQQKQLNGLLIDNRNALQQSLLKLEATEETLRRKDRLAALGEMSAGLAHEIRNPLGVISSSAQLLQTQLPNVVDKQRQLLDVIREESTRLNGLVTDFLKFGRPAEPCCECHQLNQLVQRTVEHLSTIAAEANVELHFHATPQQISAQVDGDMIQQLLLNLLLNGIDACSAGGNVSVEVTVGQNSADITIKDDGCGIDTDILPTIFNPFVTTKDHGTGLGLATAHKIAEVHNGEIRVHSEMGKGSTFTLTLPTQEC